ncbi:MAG: NADH-quinone oxidoreductase subunit NuoH [Thermoleophilia bacterium]
MPDAVSRALGLAGATPLVAVAWLTVLYDLVIVLVVLVGTLSIAAGLTWFERRLLGFFQDRLGPNRVGPAGLLQPLADTVKMFTKEDWIPPFADGALFVLAPAIIMVSVLLGFVVVPVSRTFVVADMNIGLLFFLAMSSLGVYSVVLAGWSSASKYSVIGGLRAAAQMMSYEVFMGIALTGVVLLSGSFDLNRIVAGQHGLWYVVPQFPGFIVFLLAGFAEMRRIPFDLVEAESELVAGYRTEYSGMKSGLFLVGEYLGMTLISALIVTVYFGGWLGPGLPGFLWFLIKVFIFIFFFIWVRGTLPRPRYDQLMELGWKLLLPLSLANLAITGAIILAVQK